MLSLLLSSSLLFHYIQVPVADVQQGPSPDAEVISQAIYSEEVNVLEEHETWAKVETLNDGCIGWMSRINIGDRQEEYASCTCVKPFVEVSRLSAHVYEQPDAATVPLLTLPFECRLESIDPFGEGPWLNIKLLDDSEAYILKEDVNADIRAMPMDKMVAFSNPFLDLPTLKGGRSSFGFDDAGFVQMLYRQMGFFLPRRASEQCAWENFDAVPFDMLSKGDLLFFGLSEQDIRHVGLYLGEGRCMHCSPTELKIHAIEQVATDWTYKTARRLKS